MSQKKHIVVLSKRQFGALSTRPFKTRIRGRVVKGFAVRKGSRFFAYLNRCKHLPVTLDLNDNQFFTHDKKYLQCHMHGAVYEIESGKCIGGPCTGATLDRLEVDEEESEIVISIPIPID